MPIHVRAEPGDYAEACLLPGDPLRARYIAETYLDGFEQKNSERGPIVSGALFYSPDDGQYERWCEGGVRAVEMEGSARFTIGALRGVQAGCLLIGSDIVVEGEFTRISDEDMRAAVDRMTRVALEV